MVDEKRNIMNFSKLMSFWIILLGIFVWIFGNMDGFYFSSAALIMYLLSILIERTSGCKSGIIGFPIGFFKKEDF